MIQPQPSRLFTEGVRGPSEFTRPPKRSRADDHDGGDGPALFTAQPPLNPVPDDTFYFHDEEAICFVRVQAVIFKIHPTVFDACKMLKIEFMRHVQLTGESTFQSPAVISSLTLHQFRALLWALYQTEKQLARSAHLQEEHYIPRLLTISPFANSLTHDTFRLYTERALRGAAFNEAFILSCPSATLSMLLEHFKTRDVSARDAIVDNWIKRLREDKNSFVPAILAASKLGINRLRGVACFMYLREISGKVKNSDNPYSAIHLTIDDKLEAQHVPWLLQGYFSLTHLSQRLRHKPLELPIGDSCCKGRHEKCVAVWKDRWAVISRYAKITNLPPADILILVRDMRESFSSDDEVRKGLTSDCRLAGLEAMQNLLEELGDPDVLASHFVMKKPPSPDVIY